MKVNRIKYFGIAAFLTAGTLVSCVADSNSPGLEYMPDMYRSPAAEAYVDYAEIKGVYSEDAYNLIEEKFSFIPPAGTIVYGTDDDAQFNMPYKYGAPVGADKTHGLYGVAQDSAGYANSALDVNPLAYSDDVLKQGEELYGLFCIHCHGENGDGDGAVPGTGKYPPPPAYSGGLKDLPAGQIFYSITYGKNAMGSHASQLSKKERWMLVYYVQKLQGKDPGAAVVVGAENAEEGEVIEAEGAGEEANNEGH